MKLIFFTKSLKGMDVETTGREAKAMGFEGLDVAVRPGYCVNPENAPKALPRAVHDWADMGLCVPMVTTPGDFTDPAAPVVEPLLEACAAAGVHEIKLGYWHCEDANYWQGVDAIRRALDGFQALAARHGVRCALHTHSGRNYGLNAAAVMHLVRGFDPRCIGVYLDPGHLSINGEPIEVAVEMVKDYLCLVSVKDMVYIRREEEGRVSWTHELAPLREGLVDWQKTLAALLEVGYDGPLTFHSEYRDVSLDELRALTRDDLAYLRDILLHL